MITPYLSFIDPPALNFPGVAVTVVQILLTATSYWKESTNSSPYSKFFEGKASVSAIDSRIGMSIIYGLPFLTATTFAVVSETPTLAGVLTLLLFLKRIIEVHFVHKYSGKISKIMSMVIGTYYSVVAVVIASVATKSPNGYCQIIGIAAFVIGCFGNLYHHYLLRRLRESAVGVQYVMPKTAWFEYAAAPHYFFELVEWLGIAVVAQHGNAYLVLTSMTSYLCGRAVAQNQWNEQKFPEWRNKYNMIPFVF